MIDSDITLGPAATMALIEGGRLYRRTHRRRSPLDHLGVEASVIVDAALGDLLRQEQVDVTPTPRQRERARAAVCASVAAWFHRVHPVVTPDDRDVTAAPLGTEWIRVDPVPGIGDDSEVIGTVMASMGLGYEQAQRVAERLYASMLDKLTNSTEADRLQAIDEFRSRAAGVHRYVAPADDNDLIPENWREKFVRENGTELPEDDR